MRQWRKEGSQPLRTIWADDPAQVDNRPRLWAGGTQLWGRARRGSAYEVWKEMSKRTVRKRDMTQRRPFRTSNPRGGFHKWSGDEESGIVRGSDDDWARIRLGMEG